jgi:hypothetical protein
VWSIGVFSGPELRLGFWDMNIDQKLEGGDWVGVSPFQDLNWDLGFWEGTWIIRACHLRQFLPQGLNGEALELVEQDMDQDLLSASVLN